MSPSGIPRVDGKTRIWGRKHVSQLVLVLIAHPRSPALFCICIHSYGVPGRRLKSCAIVDVQGMLLRAMLEEPNWSCHTKEIFVQGHSSKRKQLRLNISKLADASHFFRKEQPE